MKNILLLLITLVASCTTITKEECVKADWWEFGYTDLSQYGRNNNYNEIRAKACKKHKIVADSEAYSKGWNEAITTYCTSESAYNMGVQNAGLLHICGEAKYDELILLYNKGKKVYDINYKISQLTSRMHTISYSKYQKDISNSELSEINRRIKSIKSDIKKLEIEKEKYSF